MGPTSKKKKKRITNLNVEGKSVGGEDTKRWSFFNFFLYKFISQIYGNLTVGFRRDKHEKCSTQQGLRVSTRNTGFHREFK